MKPRGETGTSVRLLAGAPLPGAGAGERRRAPLAAGLGHSKLVRCRRSSERPWPAAAGGAMLWSDWDPPGHARICGLAALRDWGDAWPPVRGVALRRAAPMPFWEPAADTMPSGNDAWRALAKAGVRGPVQVPGCGDR